MALALYTETIGGHCIQCLNGNSEALSTNTVHAVKTTIQTYVQLLEQFCVAIDCSVSCEVNCDVMQQDMLRFLGLQNNLLMPGGWWMAKPLPLTV